MQLTENEKKLLELYRKDKKLKRKRVFRLILSIFLTFVLCLSLWAIGNYYYEQIKIEQKKAEKIKASKDTVKPTLELTHEKIEIVQGETLDYMKFILSAIDKKDGDLKTKVKYTKIDTSIIGETKIVYSVSDKAKNESKAVLKVVVKEKEEPKNEEVQEPQQNTSQEQPIVEQPTTPPVQEIIPQAPIEQPEPTPQPTPQAPSTQYFMFSDGYNMDNVSQACANALTSSGRAGACTPIQENGIYKGMRLDLY